MPVFFNGRLLTTPTVETSINDAGLAPQSATVGNALALIGTCEAGLPKQAIRIRGVAHAQEVLRGGSLLYAIKKAFAASPEINAPGTIYAMRVNPALSASRTFQDSASRNVLKVSATDAGLYTNNIQIKIETGTVTGKRVTTRWEDRLFTKDNLIRNALTVRYTGAETTGTIAVTDTTVTLVGGSTLNLSLAEFTTVTRLAERINAEADWTATVVRGSGSLLTLAGLDALIATNAKPADVTLTATLSAIVSWINSSSEGLLTAERVTTTAGLPPSNTTDYVYLAGGSDGTTTNTDWSDAFTALEAEDVQWLVPLTNATAIWAMADTHCQFMSTLGHRERRCFVGGGINHSLTDAADHAALINSDRTAYVYPSFYDFTYTRSPLPGYYLAAIVAAAFAGLTPGEPLTNKTLHIHGLEMPVSAPADTDYLIEHGVLTVTATTKGVYRVAKSISTWLNDANYHRVEISTGVALDYVVHTVRDRLQKYVGNKGTYLTLTRIVEETASVLRLMATLEPHGLGLLAGDDAHPPFRNITADLQGDAVFVQFECSPVIPVNYVLVTVYATAYSGSVTA